MECVQKLRNTEADVHADNECVSEEAWMDVCVCACVWYTRLEEEDQHKFSAVATAYASITVDRQLQQLQ